MLRLAARCNYSQIICSFMSLIYLFVWCFTRTQKYFPYRKAASIVVGEI